MFFNTLKGYRKQQNEQFKNEWEQTRSLEFAIIKPHLKEEHQNITKQEYNPFPWDTKQNNAKQKPSAKDVKETFAAWDKVEFKSQNK